LQKAKVEIMWLLKEELLKMQTSGIHHMSTQKPGRYKVCSDGWKMFLQISWWKQKKTDQEH
jgi:hypothetical protein